MMSIFHEYLKKFDLTSQITDEEVENAKTLLQLYAPIMRRASRCLSSTEEECQLRRSQSIMDFINLSVDYNGDIDRKRIADRLLEMGHSMQLLSILEDALLLVKEDASCNKLCYDILRARYFDAYCRNNEAAFLALDISPATYYRNIKKAIRVFAGYLWCVVIPDLVLTNHQVSTCAT